MKLHPEHTKYFSFATPDNQYEFTRLPFGFCEAPAEFQRRLVKALQPLIRENKIIVYIDDILIPSSTIADNLQVLRQVLLLLKQHDFHINLKKCSFLKKSIEYLGYIVSGHGITLSNRHTEAVRNFPQPKKLVDLQKFLGLTNYFRKFIKNYSVKVRPLQGLLRKTSIFNFDDLCKKAFEDLKAELTAFPVLQIYDPSKETQLHTDASSLAVTGILLQKQFSGLWAPIAFYSQSTNKAEANYHSFELEMLAVVKSIERFHIYLYGLEFIIITDCNALVHAVNKAHLNARIARWTLKLQNYKFKMIHRDGKRMTHVDALSRIVSYVEAMPLEKELQYRQLQDIQIKALSEKLEKEEDKNFQLIDGLVFRKGEDKPRFVIPDGMIINTIRTYHDDLAHCGFEKTIKGIQANYWFKHMNKKVREYISNCLTCLMADQSVNTREGELSLTDSPSAPLQIIHADHFGPIKESSEGFKYILVIIDAFTRFTWLLPAKSTSSKETIKLLKTVFHIFGNPNKIVSDRGTAFTSQEFSDFIKQSGLTHRLVAVAAPWANGLVERINRFLKSSLRKISEEYNLWSKHLDTVQYVMNNTHHASTGNSPSKLLLGYDQKNHTDAKLVNFLNNVVKSELDICDEREINRKLASQITDKVKNYNKIYYDEHHKRPSTYKVRDFVLIRDTVVKSTEDKKLKPQYKGPYRIEKILNKNRYVISDIPGFNIVSRPYNSILSPDRIKPWIKPVTPT